MYGHTQNWVDGDHTEWLIDSWIDVILKKADLDTVTRQSWWFEAIVLGKYQNTKGRQPISSGYIIGMKKWWVDDGRLN